jgi:hypothetical protein
MVFLLCGWSITDLALNRTNRVREALAVLDQAARALGETLLLREVREYIRSGKRFAASVSSTSDNVRLPETDKEPRPFVCGGHQLLRRIHVENAQQTPPKIARNDNIGGVPCRMGDRSSCRSGSFSYIQQQMWLLGFRQPNLSTTERARFIALRSCA